MAAVLQSSCTLSSSSPPPTKCSPLSPLRNSTSNSLLFTVPALRPRRSRSSFSSLSAQSPNPLSFSAINACLSTVDSSSSRTMTESAEKKLLLEVKDLTAIIVDSKKEVLKGVNLLVYEGEVHAIMGQNGSGKSTFSKVLAGHPDYEVTGGSVMFKGKDLLGMEPEERSLDGLFMSFQSPAEIPGVGNDMFLLMAYNARRRHLGLEELGPLEFFQYVFPKLGLVNMKSDFLNRNVNEGFSGGERKRNEILQLMVLGADLAILDEIDSGLDIDALKDVTNAVKGFLTSSNSVLMITHYQRLLDYIEPTYTHIMEDGRIVKTGDKTLAKFIEKEGYKGISDA